MSSIIHCIPNLIVGQGSVGFALRERLLKTYPGLWQTWSKSGRHHSTYQGDIGDYQPIELFDTVMILLSPQSRSEAQYRLLYEHSLPKFLSRLQARRVIFCSSTAVYKQEPKWFSENCETDSSHFRGRSLLAAERAVQYYFPHRSVILRASGLVKTTADLKERSKKSDYQWINYLYEADLIKVIEHFYSSSALSGVYNITRSPFFCGYEKKLGKKVCHLKLLSTLSINLTQEL